MSNLARFSLKVAKSSTEAVDDLAAGQVDRSLFFDGWRSWIDRALRPLQKAMNDIPLTIALHHPFGTWHDLVPHGSMVPDGWLIAEQRFPVLLQEFIDAWSDELEQGSVQQLMIYEGRGVEGLHTLQRLQAAAEPILVLHEKFPGRIIAARDNAAGEPAGSVEHRHCVWLADRGVPVAVEAIPRLGDTHWLEFDSLATERFYLGEANESIMRWQDGVGWVGPQTKRRFTPADHARAGSSQHWVATLSGYRKFDDTASYFAHIAGRIRRGFVVWLDDGQVLRHGGADFIRRLEEAFPAIGMREWNQVIGNLRGSGPTGDFTGDGIVDMRDLNWVQGNWGPRANITPFEQDAV